MLYYQEETLIKTPFQRLQTSEQDAYSRAHADRSKGTSIMPNSLSTGTGVSNDTSTCVSRKYRQASRTGTQSNRKDLSSC